MNNEYRHTIDQYITANYPSYISYANKVICKKNKTLNIHDSNRGADITNTVILYLYSRVAEFKLFCLATGHTLNNYICQAIKLNCQSKKSPYMQKELKYQHLRFESEFNKGADNADPDNMDKSEFDNIVENYLSLEFNYEQYRNEIIGDEENKLDVINEILNNNKEINWADKTIFLDYIYHRDYGFKELAEKYHLSIQIVYQMFKRVKEIIITDLKNNNQHALLGRKNNLILNKMNEKKYK